MPLSFSSWATSSKLSSLPISTVAEASALPSPSTSFAQFQPTVAKNAEMPMMNST